MVPGAPVKTGPSTSAGTLGNGTDWTRLRILQPSEAVTLKEAWDSLGGEAQDTCPKSSIEERQVGLRDFGITLTPKRGDARRGQGAMRL